MQRPTPSDAEYDLPSHVPGAAEPPRQPRWVSASRAGVRSESLRTTNLSMVLQALHFGGPSTRSQLVELTGLTRSSVAALVGDLVGAGLVAERPAVSDGNPGRPSPEVAAAPERAVLAFEIAVDSVAVAVVALGGSLLEQERLDRPRDRVSLDQTLDDIDGLARTARARAGDPELLGVGVAVAGAVSRTRNVVTMAPNLGWRDTPLGDLIRQACDLDPRVDVAVANDGDLAARAESRRGSAVGHRDIIYISGEVGVAGGVLTSGMSVVGSEGFGGEVGHVPVNPDGRRCGCGARGCWETEVGEQAILLRAGLDPDGGHSALQVLLGAAEAADPTTLGALAETGRWLGIGMAGLINLFNPSLVVLGGTFRRALPYLDETLRAELAVRVFTPMSNVEIIPSALGNAAPLIGAAEIAFEPVLADPLHAR